MVEQIFEDCITWMTFYGSELSDLTGVDEGSGQIRGRREKTGSDI